MGIDYTEEVGGYQLGGYMYYCYYYPACVVYALHFSHTD